MQRHPRQPLEAAPLRPDLVDYSIHRRHAVFATVAVTLSLMLHVAVIAFILVVPMNLPVFNRVTAWLETPPRRFMQLRETESRPATQAAAAERAAVEMQAAMAVSEATGALEVPTATVDREPPALRPGQQIDTAPLIEESPVMPPARVWQPRQEILKVEDAIVKDNAGEHARRTIPEIDRVRAAPDVVYPVDIALLQAAASAAPAGGSVGAGAPGVAEIASPAAGAAIAVTPAGVDLAEADARSGATAFRETPETITPVKALENFLSADIAVTASKRDPDFGYFELRIRRRSESVLPVIPKDILFIQDCSASMAEQRLYFCREGLQSAIDAIGPHDRFNIMAFRDTVNFCFDDWASNGAEERLRAANFIAALTSEGETDVFAAVKALLGLKVQPGRPLIAMLVTDGHATTGVRDGSEIIREFSRANQGQVSVFTMGTIDEAYMYLLDLLSYCNRGDARVITKGRWEIPEVLVTLAREVSQPVLSDVNIRVAEATPSEVYPVQTMNLFSDRELVLYGRYARGQEHVVVRAAGRAADAEGDMIFDMNLTDAPEGDEEIRKEWARQKVYYLIGEYARVRHPTILAAIKATAKFYRVSIPYRDEL